MSLRRRTWEILEVARPGDRVSRIFDLSLLVLIALNVLAVVLESVDEFAARFRGLLVGFEAFSVIVFSLEYLGRLWSCVEDERFGARWKGRFRFAWRPMSLVDLMAVLPSLIAALAIDLRFLRALRLLRLVRVLKAGRYVKALRILQGVFAKKREELVITMAATVLLLVVASSLVYLAEHEVQPDAFPHIPSAMWWGVATLTTVGYGDVYPITAVGRLLGACVAILGVGLFALPAGIIGSGFVEAIQERKEESRCPHCGELLP